MNILQEIFKDNYEVIQYTLHPRAVEMENIGVFTIDEELMHFFLEDCSLLGEMKKRIGPSFKKTKALIYRKDKNGFYVYAKPSLSDSNTVIKYISRYLGRPVIALSRIDSYDGENVTFHYNRHEDDAFVQKTVPVIDFIKLLIQHIPERNFKMTRYYGLYARHRANAPSPGCRAVHPSKHNILRNFNRWREMILLSFGYDPFQCPDCKKEINTGGFSTWKNNSSGNLDRNTSKPLRKA